MTSYRSSPAVAGRWHGAGYGARPLAQVREFVALLRACLSGERVDFEGDFYRISRFRLGVRLRDWGASTLPIDLPADAVVREVRVNGKIKNLTPPVPLPPANPSRQAGGTGFTPGLTAGVRRGLANPGR